jgi:hypothetical protein
MMVALSVAWGFLRGLPWKYIGLAVAVLGLAGGLFMAGAHHQHAKDAKALAAVQADLRTEHENVGKLLAAIGHQNASLTALAAEGNQRTAAADKALQAASGAVERANRAGGRIMVLTAGTPHRFSKDSRWSRRAGLASASPRKARERANHSPPTVAPANSLAAQITRSE